MILRMLRQSWRRNPRQSWRRNPRRKLLAVATVFLAASLLSALMLVSIDIGDQMAREMKSYGANILIEPAEQAVLPSLFGRDDDNPLAGQSALEASELPNIMDIFWRNNIVGFAPLLDGEVAANGQPVRVIGTFFDRFFDRELAVADEPDYRTGQKIVSPYWQVEGAWPHDERNEVLAGVDLARRHGWGVGSTLTIGGDSVRVTGVLNSGGDEEDALIVPLALAQKRWRWRKSGWGSPARSAACAYRR